MFFFFSKVLTLFLFPFTLAIVLGVLLQFFIRNKKDRILSVIPILLLWFFGSFPVAQFLAMSLEQNYPPVTFAAVEKAGAIVVLGGMINNLSLHENRIELSDAVERLTDAVSLFKRKKAPFILVSSGSGVLFHQKDPESFYAKKFLVEMGLPDSAVLVETKSRNTAENSIFSAQILRNQHVKKIILVTSAFHMKRSEALFKKQGFEVIAFPTDYKSLKPSLAFDTFIPTLGALGTSTLCIKEWAGILAYKMKGYL